jgi:hypothetical protein
MGHLAPSPAGNSLGFGLGGWSLASFKGLQLGAASELPVWQRCVRVLIYHVGWDTCTHTCPSPWDPKFRCRDLIVRQDTILSFYLRSHVPHMAGPPHL